VAVAVPVPASFSARQSPMDDGSRTSSREGKGRKACGTVQTISAVQAGLAWCACTRCEQLGERATESDASAAASKLLVTLRERGREEAARNQPSSLVQARACVSIRSGRPSENTATSRSNVYTYGGVAARWIDRNCKMLQKFTCSLSSLGFSMPPVLVYCRATTLFVQRKLATVNLGRIMEMWLSRRVCL